MSAPICSIVQINFLDEYVKTGAMNADLRQQLNVVFSVVGLVEGIGLSVLVFESLQVEVGEVELEEVEVNLTLA